MINESESNTSEAVTNIDDALTLIGGFGFFQWVMTFITMGNYVRSALTYYPLPYMELFPVYKCTNLTTGEVYECEPDDFCNDSNISETIDWDAETSLHNWVEQLDLTCKSNSEIGLIGSSYFIGIMVSVFVLPRLSDLYGRKWPIIFCQFIQVPAYIWMFYMSSLIEAYVIFLCMGLAFGGSISINSLYMQEFLSVRYRAIALTVGQTIEGMTVALLVCYFAYWTKYWQGWYWMCFGMQILVIIGMFWLPESPQFYFAKGRFEEAKVVLLKIAKINGCQIDESMICFDKVGEHGQGPAESDSEDEIKPIGSARGVKDISQGFAQEEPKKKVEMKHC